MISLEDCVALSGLTEEQVLDTKLKLSQTSESGH